MDDASVQELLWNNNDDQKVESRSYHFVAWKMPPQGLGWRKKKMSPEAKRIAKLKIEVIFKYINLQ